MNSTNNSSESYFSKEHWYALFGSTPLLNAIFLYLVTPFAILGVFANILSFYILGSEKLKTIPLYSYLRVYSINSLFICLMESIFFIPNTYGRLSISNSYGSVFYISYFHVGLQNTLVLFGSFMDICISLDRIVVFYPKVRSKLLNLSHYKISLVLFLISAAICSQYFFIFNPSCMDVKLNETETLRLFMWKNTEFSLSLAGEILNYTNYFIRDILIFLVEIVLNVVSVCILKKHLNKKVKSLTFELKSQKDLSHAGTKSDKASSVLIKPNSLTQNVDTKKVNEANLDPNAKNKSTSALKLAERSETNATLMVVLICILSGFEHLLFITMAIYFNYIRNETAFLIGVLGNLGITLKHFFNFIIFYMFNRVFKLEFDQLVKVCFKRK